MSAIAADLKSSCELTPDQIASYQRDGYLVIPSLAGPHDVNVVRTLMLPLFEQYAQLPSRNRYNLGAQDEPANVGQIPAVSEASVLAPELRRTVAYRRMMRVATQLLGHRAEYIWDSAINKPALNRSETPWHQDAAIYQLTEQRKPRSVVYFWFALQPADAHNGGIQFIPRSHRGLRLPHRYRPGSAALVADGVDTSHAVQCTLAPGGATVHHPWMLHYTGPNQSDEPRLAWVVALGKPYWPRPLRLAVGAARAALRTMTWPLRRPA